MIRIFIAGAMLATLAACGGGSKSRVQSTHSNTTRYAGLNVTVDRQAFATGPISAACMSGGRKAANTRLCGCVQAVANQTLRSSTDQRLAASFFADPHQAQVIRQSDNPNHEAFWQRYKGFSAQAERSCSGL